MAFGANCKYFSNLVLDVLQAYILWNFFLAMPLLQSFNDMLYRIHSPNEYKYASNYSYRLV